MLDKEWIRLYSEDKQSRKKKQYMITERGSLALQQEIKRLEELLENGRRILQETDVKSEEMANQDGELKMEEKEGAADEKVQVVF